MNHIAVSGIIDNVPELRHTTSGSSVLNFSVAVEEPQRANRQASPLFLRVAVFGDQADKLSTALGKHTRVLVAGRLQIRPYTNRNGDKKFSTEIVANSVEILDETTAASQDAPAPEPTADDDIPF